MELLLEYGLFFVMEEWFEFKELGDEHMIFRTHGESKEWSRLTMMSFWDVNRSHKFNCSTWWIFGKELYRSNNWKWSIFWAGIPLRR